MEKPRKQERVSARVSVEMKARLRTVADERGVDEADLIRECVTALCDYFDHYGTLPREIAIRPSDAELDRMRRQLNDHIEFAAGRKGDNSGRKRRIG